MNYCKFGEKLFLIIEVIIKISINIEGFFNVKTNWQVSKDSISLRPPLKWVVMRGFFVLL